MNRYLLAVIHLGSLVLLGFGWVLDMLKIDVNAHFIIDVSLFSEKRSVLGTLESLWQTANYFPFLLILFFGIIIPLVKSTLIFYLLLAKQAVPFWYKFVAAINKWAMADVFAISIFVAFLGAGAMENTSAVLLPGFYFFAAYVLVSGVLGIFLSKLMKDQLESKA